VYIADSRREIPGQGHTDFAAFAHAIKDIGFNGWYTMEFLPSTSNPCLAAELGLNE
jgi:sugar phosphate isomerase/epimerase